MPAVKSFVSVERALKQVILDLETDEPLNPNWIGGDFRYDPDVMPWYIRIDRVTSAANQFSGDFTVDVEVFGSDYLVTEAMAFAIEALLLSSPHRVVVDGKTVILDNVEQNLGVDNLPWDDDSTYRMSATYVVTMRR